MPLPLVGDIDEEQEEKDKLAVAQLRFIYSELLSFNLRPQNLQSVWLNFTHINVLREFLVISFERVVSKLPCFPK